MKLNLLISATLASLLVSGAAIAGNDCTDPMADWQPREVLRQKLEQHGWTVQRIKIDDGCYEVRGVDKNGNPVEPQSNGQPVTSITIEAPYKSAADEYGL